MCYFITRLFISIFYCGQWITKINILKSIYYLGVAGKECTELGTEILDLVQVWPYHHISWHRWVLLSRWWHAFWSLTLQINANFIIILITKTNSERKRKDYGNKKLSIRISAQVEYKWGNVLIILNVLREGKSIHHRWISLSRFSLPFKNVQFVSLKILDPKKS